MGQILVPPDSTAPGANPIRTIILPSGLYVPAADVGAEQQVISQAGPDGTLAGVSPYGYTRVTPEPEALFNDPFDGAIDTVDRWTTGGTATPTVTGGVVSVTSGSTTVSASSSLASKPTFAPVGLNFRTFGLVGKFENNGAANGTAFGGNTHRFWGLATVPGTWQATLGVAGTSGPILDGVGFEIATDGLLYPVIYSNGTRTIASITGGGASLNASRALANGQWHQFAITMRADAIYWFIDGLSQPAATFSFANAGFTLPNVQTLPIRLHTINNTVAPPAAPTLQFSAVGMGDTGNNTTQISDGQHSFRKAKVTDPTVIPNALLYGAGALTNGAAVNTNTNAVQLATYKAIAKPSAAALVAGTLSYRVALHHAATATKTVKIRKIECNVLMSAVAEGALIEVHKFTTTAPTGAAIAGVGTAATGSLIPAHPADPAAEAVLTNSTTAIGTFAGIVATGYLSQGAATTHAGGTDIYVWPDASLVKPITLRPGVLEGIAIGIISNAAVTPTLTVDIAFTEE